MTKVHANTLQGGELLISQTAGVTVGQGSVGKAELETEHTVLQTRQRRTLSTRGSTPRRTTRSLSLSSHYGSLTLVRSICSEPGL